MKKLRASTAVFVLASILILSAGTLWASAAAEAGAEAGAAETAGMDAAFEGLDRNTYFTVSEFERLTGRKIERYSEAPMLAALVAAGELPPVEERLPENPLVQLPLAAEKRNWHVWRDVPHQHTVWLHVARRTNAQSLHH